MKNKNTVTRLALSQLRFHKSRTLLTGIAIMLTTTLLAAIGTSAIALFDLNRQDALSQTNYHAAFARVTPEQFAVLSNHIETEALTARQVFAEIIDGKMNGSLNCLETVKDGIYFSGMPLEEGRFPENVDDICSSPAFFRRVGAEPVLGGKVTLSIRVGGKGEIITRDFTVCGLFPDVEVPDDVDDSRIAWSAYVSQALLDEYEKAGLYEPVWQAYLRVYGEENLTYDAITEKIYGVAADLGLDKETVILNKQYLYTMTDPGTEIMMIAGVICLIVIVFSALVIYSIYYVSVITDVQEIGRLKAIGASKGHIARLFFCEGTIVSACAIPLGLLLGYLLPYFLFPVIMGLVGTDRNAAAGDAPMKLHMFSPTLLLAVAAATLITVALSLLKPIRMAKRISPIEAIRYQEGSLGGKLRRGHREVRVSVLTLANLWRNKRRTAVTILTMGLSCVLFVCVSAVLSSVSAEDLARRNIPAGDFRISLDYSSHDKEYPENNLDSLVQKNFFNDSFLSSLSSMEGVEKVTRAHGKLLASTNEESLLSEDYENRIPLSYFTRDDLTELNGNLVQGSIDYDRMTANKEIVCTHVYSFEQYGLSLGDSFSLTLLDGDREIPLTATLTALTQPDATFPLFIMTEDTWNSLGLAYDPTTDILLHVKDAQYDSIKEALYDIVSENPYFNLISLDEEMKIGRMQLGTTKYPAYLVLGIIAVISFMNLINTMITSIVTRKKELGILQAIGLSNKQLSRMLSGEGLIFTAGTLLISLTVGNLFGYMLFLWAKEEHFMSLSRYHYPLLETAALALVLLIGQCAVTFFISKKVEKESLIERIRNE